MSTRRAIAIAAVGALSLSLAACDPGEAEEVDPPTSSSPAPTSEAPTSEAPPTTEAPTAEPATTAPAVPPPNPADFPGMDQQTEEGAKQAYRYFWAAIVYGYQTGDASIVEGMSMPQCVYCVSVKDDIQRLKTANALWGPTTIEDRLLESKAEGDGKVVVTYVIDVSAHEEIDPQTGATTQSPIETYGTAGGAVWVEGGWKIDGTAIDI